VRPVEGVVECRSPLLVSSTTGRFEVVVQHANIESFGWLSDTMARVLAVELGRRTRGVRMGVLRRLLKSHAKGSVKVVNAALKLIAADPRYAGLAAIHREMIERLRVSSDGRTVVGDFHAEWEVSKDIAAQLVHDLEAQGKIGSKV